MAKRKASIGTKVEKTLVKSLPVVVGVAIVGLVIRFFGNQPVISDITAGLNGDVKGAGFFSGLFG